MREYDPLDFKHGIDTLEEAESRNDRLHRKSILKIMLHDLNAMRGSLHSELTDYVIELTHFPDDPVDITKLHELNYEVAVGWGSSTDYELIKSEARVKYLLPSAQRGIDVVDGASVGGKTRRKWPQRKEEMQQEIDLIYTKNPNHSYERIKQIASERHGYPLSALKRYTKNPHRK